MAQPAGGTETTVSTHSRPKAAGYIDLVEAIPIEFQHTAARRRLAAVLFGFEIKVDVSTHSRPKAAGNLKAGIWEIPIVSTHSRPKAAGPNNRRDGRFLLVSTHSRPKAAGDSPVTDIAGALFQHTAARRRLGPLSVTPHKFVLFQHTAARRRLAQGQSGGVKGVKVSTHSRPKAAGQPPPFSRPFL